MAFLDSLVSLLTPFNLSSWSTRDSSIAFLDSLVSLLKPFNLSSLSTKDSSNT